MTSMNRLPDRKWGMPPDLAGAQRAAALLRALDGRVRPLRVNEIRSALEDQGIDDLPEDQESLARAWHRAVDDLLAIGVTVAADRNALRIEQAADPAASPMLAITDAENELRRRVGNLLWRLNPEYEASSDPGVFVKMHVPRDCLKFVYGADEQPRSRVAGD
jgi:hypothetical protein